MIFNDILWDTPCKPDSGFKACIVWAGQAGDWGGRRTQAAGSKTCEEVDPSHSGQFPKIQTRFEADPTGNQAIALLATENDACEVNARFGREDCPLPASRSSGTDFCGWAARKVVSLLRCVLPPSTKQGDVWIQSARLADRDRKWDCEGVSRKRAAGARLLDGRGKACANQRVPRKILKRHFFF